MRQGREMTALRPWAEDVELELLAESIGGIFEEDGWKWAYGIEAGA